MFNTSLKKSLILMSLLFILSVGVLTVQAQSFINQVSGGAVGFKVLPNPEHLPPLEWYNRYIPATSQGAPRELIIDGYQAVEDGRSIYVNAANYVGGTLYTNIYVFSYDANDPDGFTKEIFDRISDNLHFTQIPGSFGPTGRGTCGGPNGSACESDFDCDTAAIPRETCTNIKGEAIRRDTRRAADIITFNDKLRAFSNSFGTLPQLLAGTFVSGVSYSTWPSWRATLSEALGEQLPTDPLNQFLCPSGTDPVTCWNAVQREFVCPGFGYAYGYQYTSSTLGSPLQETGVFGANFETGEANVLVGSGGWNPGVGTSIGNCNINFSLTASNDTDQDSIPNALDNCDASINPNQRDSDADGIGDACDVCPFDQYNDSDCTLRTFGCDAPLTTWTTGIQTCNDPLPATSIGSLTSLGGQSYRLASPECYAKGTIGLNNPAPFVGDFDISMQLDDLMIAPYTTPGSAITTRYSQAIALAMNFSAAGIPNQGAGIAIAVHVHDTIRLGFSYIFNAECWLDPTTVPNPYDAGVVCPPGSMSADFVSHWALPGAYNYTPGDTLRLTRSGSRVDFLLESVNGNIGWTYPQPGDPPASTADGIVRIQAGKGGIVPTTLPDPSRQGVATQAEITWTAICANVPPIYPCAVEGSGDGICADIDNCFNISNVNQLDTDGDGIGDACENSCGDGFIDIAGGEQCDPLTPGTTPPLCTNNLPNTFGTVTCFDASAGPARQCTWNYSQCTAGTCGNGFLEPNEECEDGDFQITACTTADAYSGFERRDCIPSTQAGGCTWAPYNQFFDTILNVNATCSRTGSCGDGTLQSPPEQCDLGASNGPNSTCSTICTTIIASSGTCGNGDADIGEECGEGGLPVDPTTCSALGKPGGSIVVTCDFATCLWNDDLACSLSVCGDGSLEIGEECIDDLARTTDSTCFDIGEPQGTSTPVSCNTTNCTWPRSSCVFIPNSCGNGVREGGEQCDDTNNVSNDECSAGCLIEFCGDGILQNNIRPRTSAGAYIGGSTLREMCDFNTTSPNWDTITQLCDTTCQIVPRGPISMTVLTDVSVPVCSAGNPVRTFALPSVAAAAALTDPTQLVEFCVYGTTLSPFYNGIGANPSSSQDGCHRPGIRASGRLAEQDPSDVFTNSDPNDNIIHRLGDRGPYCIPPMGDTTRNGINNSPYPRRFGDSDICTTGAECSGTDICADISYKFTQEGSGVAIFQEVQLAFDVDSHVWWFEIWHTDQSGSCNVPNPFPSFDVNFFQ